MARPLQGRLIDRDGPRVVLIGTGCVHVVAVAAMTEGARLGMASWVLIGFAWLAGLGLPPVSVAMRIEWARRMPPDRRTAAYSLVFAVQEMAVLIGPLLFGAVVALASASIAIEVTALAAGAGTLGLAFVMHGTRSMEMSAPGGNVLRNRRMWLLLAVVVLLGGALGAMEVCLPAIASAKDVPALSGLLVATVSLGGIVGAVCHARVRWSVRPAVRLVLLLLAGGLALIPAGVLTKLFVLALMLFLAGAAFNPALATTSLLVDDLGLAPGEAFGWLSTAVSAGAAAGAGLAGAMAEHAGAESDLLLAGAFGILGALLSLTLTRLPSTADRKRPSIAGSEQSTAGVNGLPGDPSP
jgi:predicted MFS family arabinose efflux permease